MGRLPDTFAQRKITFRQPYEMYGAISMTTGLPNKQFPDATFMNSTDKPFEIHRLIPRVVALDTNGVLLPTQPDQELLAQLILVLITDVGKITQFMRTPTPLGNLTKGSSERTWEFAEPYYLVKGEQFQIVANADTFPSISDLVSLSVRLTFEGFFLTIAPPSENR